MQYNLVSQKKQKRGILCIWAESTLQRLKMNGSCLIHIEIGPCLDLDPSYICMSPHSFCMGYEVFNFRANQYLCYVSFFIKILVHAYICIDPRRFIWDRGI